MSHQDRTLVAAGEAVSRRDLGIAPDNAESQARVALVSLPRKSAWPRRLAAVVGTAMLLVMALWIGNPLLAPMKLDQEKIAEAGRMLSDGIPYRVPDLEIDYAALRSAQISELPETPDVVILGGTPWRHLHQDLGWGASVFNAFHPGVSVTDIRRTVQSLSAAGRLPGRILLSIEPTLLAAPSAPDSKLLKRLSVEHVFRAILGKSTGTGPDVSMTGHTGHVLLPDGSALLLGETAVYGLPEQREMRVISSAGRWASQRIEVSPSSIEALDRLLIYLAKQGVSVTLAIPPVHPRLWELTEGTPYRTSLEASGEAARDIADRHGLSVIGGHVLTNPVCGTEAYLTPLVPDSACLDWLVREWTVSSVSES